MGSSVPPGFRSIPGMATTGAAPRPASSPICVDYVPRAIARGPGPCASTRASDPPRRATAASRCCWRGGKPGCRWPSTSPPRSAMPDDPLAEGEVGRVGVHIDTLADMETLFADIPLGEVTTSMTINATAALLLLLYQLVGERQGVDPAK